MLKVENDRRIDEDKDEKLQNKSDDRFSEMCQADKALQMDLCCSNCMRRNTQTTVKSKIYQIDFYTTWLDDVKGIQSTLRHIKAKRTRNGLKKVPLCTDCMKFLGRYSRVKDIVRHLREFSWAAFLYNFLTLGPNKSKACFVDIYNARTLWQFLPDSVKEYWRKSLLADKSLPYHEFLFTAEEPGSLFVDKTDQFNEFYSDIQSYDIGKIPKALNPNHFVPPGSVLLEENMIPNVRCLWGCSEFLHRTKTLDLSLITQHHLPHAIFNLP